MKLIGRVMLLMAAGSLVALTTSACDPPPGVPTRLELSIADQRLRVFSGDALIQDFPVSSGKNNSTPRGEFTVISKSSYTTSLHDPSVSMRFMTRFLPKIGFHGIPRKNGTPLSTPLGQRAVSAGCVRMDDDAAAWIYHNVPIGTPVIVK